MIVKARKPPQTTSDFLDLLTDFLADSSEESIEEVEANLREEGIDPEEVADTIENLVHEKLDEYRLGCGGCARGHVLRRAEHGDGAVGGDEGGGC